MSQFDFLRMLILKAQSEESKKRGTMTVYTHPGQLIAELLDERGWSQRTLALVLEKDDGNGDGVESPASSH